MSNIELYREAINKIDDYFEYQNQSSIDKKRVMSIIDELTDQLSILSDKVTVYYVIDNDGAGGANLRWFKTLEDANHFEEGMTEGFGESTINSIETFVDSQVYREAEEYVCEDYGSI